MKDDGRPIGIGFQERVSNRSELLRSRDVVVSVGRKVSGEDLGQVSVQKASVSKPTDDASLRCQVSSKSGALFSPETSPREA